MREGKKLDSVYVNATTTTNTVIIPNRNDQLVRPVKLAPAQCRNRTLAGAPSTPRLCPLGTHISTTLASIRSGTQRGAIPTESRNKQHCRIQSGLVGYGLSHSQQYHNANPISSEQSWSKQQGKYRSSIWISSLYVKQLYSTTALPAASITNVMAGTRKIDKR